MGKQGRYQDFPLAPRVPGVPIHRWLYAELRRAVIEGRARPGTRLPSSRSLARQQSIARATVVAVFEQLQIEGYFVSRVGSGTEVARELPDQFIVAVPSSAPGRRPVAKPGAPILRPTDPVPAVPRVFTVCEPAVDIFPLKTWAQLTARRLRLGGRALLDKGDPRGWRPLREAVATYLNSARSVRCDPGQVMIVNGTQQALDLAARLLLQPGDPVWIENPGYGGAAGAFRAAGARLVPVPVDASGFNPSAAVRRAAVPRLAYVTPAHQFPLGVALSLERRLALLALAGRHDFRIFEDDYDGEYRYDVRPLGSLQDHDHGGRVIYAGSFNKLLFSSLRLGYVVLPVDLVEPMLALRDCVDRYPPTLEQAVLADFFQEGAFDRHIRTSRAIYLERRDILLSAARRHLRGLVEMQSTNAGFHLLGWLQGRITDLQAEARAAAQSVRVVPLSGFYFEKPVHHGLLLGFSASKPAEIVGAVERLARALGGR